MLAILSPAKDMKVQPHAPKATSIYTLPAFIRHSNLINKELKKLNQAELAGLMKISDKLAQLNYDRIRNWNPKHDANNASHAVLSFTGEAYRGLNAIDFSEMDLLYVQNTLRILSGLYGILQPLDLIQPYRLEMGTKHGFADSKNLYAFWSNQLTDALENAVDNSPGDKVLINVASSEYASAIDFKRMKSRVVTPLFYEENHGKLKMIAVYAKKSRGMMVRFMVKNKIEKIDDLKAFDSEGYFFDMNRSTDDEWFFIR